MVCAVMVSSSQCAGQVCLQAALLVSNCTNKGKHGRNATINPKSEWPRNMAHRWGTDEVQVTELESNGRVWQGKLGQ